MPLTVRLRAALRGLHESLERLPFAQRLADGSVGRAEYVRSLEALGAVHFALERAIDDAPELAGLHEPAMDRSASLARDVEKLDPDNVLVGAPPEALAAAVALGEVLKATSKSDPWFLAGALYVSEGSRMGSMLLAKSLSRALGVPPLPGHGLDYHVDGLATRAADWQAFRGKLDGLAAGQPEREAAAERGAVAMMQGLHAIYSALGGSAA